MSYVQLMTRALGLTLVVLTIVLAALISLVVVTLDGLSHDVYFTGRFSAAPGSIPVFYGTVRVYNPGPLELENVSAGLGLYTPQGLALQSYSGSTNVGVGENISIPVNLSMSVSGASACRLLFYGSDERFGLLLNATVGGFFPFYVKSYTNFSLGALLDNLTVRIVVGRSSQSGVLYSLQYAFTDNDSYIPVNATLDVVFGQVSVATIPLRAYPMQHVYESDNFTAPPTTPQVVAVFVDSLWGSFELAQVAPYTYSGGVACA